MLLGSKQVTNSYLSLHAQGTICKLSGFGSFNLPSNGSFQMGLFVQGNLSNFSAKEPLSGRHGISGCGRIFGGTLSGSPPFDMGKQARCASHTSGAPFHRGKLEIVGKSDSWEAGIEHIGLPLIEGAIQ